MDAFLTSCLALLTCDFNWLYWGFRNHLWSIILVMAVWLHVQRFIPLHGLLILFNEVLEMPLARRFLYLLDRLRLNSLPALYLGFPLLRETVQVIFKDGTLSLIVACFLCLLCLDLNRLKTETSDMHPVEIWDMFEVVALISSLFAIANEQGAAFESRLSFHFWSFGALAEQASILQAVLQVTVTILLLLVEASASLPVKRVRVYDRWNELLICDWWGFNFLLAVRDWLVFLFLFVDGHISFWVFFSMGRNTSWGRYAASSDCYSFGGVHLDVSCHMIDLSSRYFTLNANRSALLAIEHSLHACFFSLDGGEFLLC